MNAPPAELFVDTSAWYALADESDLHHEQAARFYPGYLKDYRRLVTTNLVISETYTLIRRMLGHRGAVSFAETIFASPRIKIIYSTREMEGKACEMLKRFADQDFSYTDGVSFSIMSNLEIAKAFTFDKHFVVAGFTPIPGL